ncbi:hypothetical protein SLEP1_g34276 [Rubroshorea leprosula]|uniref:RRP12-like protein n=1 Tax=Rubroshorea leprosula TaxID=152421 RepID=A0AAV5KJ93_9ROSI|nr:hypothetical protein SLEP1_g34276 [Rubroshorea leprosula]
MEGIEMEGTVISSADEFCESILSHFSNSTQEHQHLCATIGTMAQELKDQNITLTPLALAYFGATLSSLDHLLSTTDPPHKVVQSFTTIVSLVLPTIPAGVVKKSGNFVWKTVVGALRMSSVTDGLVLPGLKCISHLLTTGDQANWSNLGQLYGVLLGYVTDSRSKVRKQAHLCLRDVLQVFQGTSALAPASEGITNVFEGFLLLSESSKADSDEGPRGVHEVLYVLDAFKDCLPLMSMNLYVVCAHPTKEVSADSVLDLLCSVALSVSTDEKSAVALTFNARLLSMGMIKIYSLHKQTCVIKLPIIFKFNALKEILASEHEEAIYAAMEAFKNLINACVDETLIKQGVDQIINTNMDAINPGPTTMEKLCVTMESLLNYHYSAVWDVAFNVISAMFDKLAPGAMGPETFLGLLPLNLEANDPSEVNVQLFPTLKQYVIGAHLNFFTDTLLGMIGKMRQRSQQLQLEGRIFSSRSSDALVYSVWAQQFDLAVALLPGLDEQALDPLFNAIKPALQNCDEYLSSKLEEELLQRMIEVLPSCHLSVKRHRLDCLYYLIAYISKVQNESVNLRHVILGSFLSEIRLALEEANKKTRNRAYEVLVQIGRACGDEETGGKRESLHQIFNMVAAGVAGETPHMISAAVKGLARLAYEFSDLVLAAYKLLPSTFLLIQRKNKEIIKANLGLLKVLVAKSQAQELGAHLGILVQGLLSSEDDTKNHFKVKVKILLEMLAQKCGLDAVKTVMPEEHMKLLTNIRKIKKRKEGKLSANSVESKSQLSKATISRVSRWNHTKVFSDFAGEGTEDSDGEYIDSETTIPRRRSWVSKRLKSKASLLQTKKKRRADKSLPEDLSALPSSQLKQKHDSDDEPEIDSEGRSILHDGGKPKKKTQKRRKTSESGWAYTGGEYASKKGGGDVKRKDKLEPFAYWPLDRKMMSRRPEYHAAARKGMASVVKLTKKLEDKIASSALPLKLTEFNKPPKRVSKRKCKTF